MDDLNSTISSILGDPAKMEQLRAVAESLGINTGGGSPPPPPAQTPPQDNNSGSTSPMGGIDPSAIASILQNFQNMGGGGQQQNNNTQQSAGGGSPNLNTVAQIAQIMQTFNQSDKNVDLLRSLKPHFSAARAGRIDDAVRIMQVIRVWPSLRDSGLLGNLGNFFGGGGNGR